MVARCREEESIEDGSRLVPELGRRIPSATVLPHVRCVSPFFTRFLQFFSGTKVREHVLFLA